MCWTVYGTGVIYHGSWFDDSEMWAKFTEELARYKPYYIMDGKEYHRKLWLEWTPERRKS